jgi:hypothetical protein
MTESEKLNVKLAGDKMKRIMWVIDVALIILVLPFTLLGIIARLTFNGIEAGWWTTDVLLKAVYRKSKGMK